MRSFRKSFLVSFLKPLLPFLFIAAGPQPSFAFRNEPDGFAEARFGMSLEGVRKIFSQLREVASEPGVPWAFYAVEGQTYLGLHPCKVTFGFFQDKLYEAKLDCGRKDQVRSVLFRQFGEPSSADDEMWIWRSDKALVSMNRKAMTFALADPKRSRLLHEYLLQLVLTREFEAREKQITGEPGAQPASSPP